MTAGAVRPSVRPLGLRFFRRPAEVVAADLLGALVISRRRGGITAGRIVETEAYLGVTDPASHAYRHRRHAGNGALYGPPGTWYVYRSYGVHWCANLVCAGGPLGSAVLLRALEPLEGVPVMQRRRGRRAQAVLCNGPGKLTEALGIDQGLNGLPMHSAPVMVARGTAVSPARREATPRIGITKAADWPLRFVEADSPWLSRRR